MSLPLDTMNYGELFRITLPETILEVALFWY